MAGKETAPDLGGKICLFLCGGISVLRTCCTRKKAREGRNEPTIYIINTSADKKNWDLIEEIRKKNETEYSHLDKDESADWRHPNFRGSTFCLKERKPK